MKARKSHVFSMSSYKNTTGLYLIAANDEGLCVNNNIVIFPHKSITYLYIRNISASN